MTRTNIYPVACHTILVALTFTTFAIISTADKCPVAVRNSPTRRDICAFPVPKATGAITGRQRRIIRPAQTQPWRQKAPTIDSEIDFHVDADTAKPDIDSSSRQSLGSGATFKLSVSSPPSQQHLQAVQRCVGLAAATWISNVETRAKFYFSSTLGAANILGDARPGTTWYVDGYLYPVAMAKSLLEEDVNALHYGDERYDIIVRLNSRTNWYIGLDAQPGEDQYDLITVCLHELYHGLMVSGGNMKIEKNITDGTYTGSFLSNIDRRFDAFLACETAAGDCGIPSYRGVDGLLGQAVTGNALWFRSSTERIARLYAPPEFKFGSSVYHLAENEYGDGNNANSLMTPSMPMGYAQHKIGSLVLRMQELMLNDSEFGAPLCNSSTIPITKEDLAKPKPKTPGNGNTANSQAGCIMKMGSSCMGIGVLVGIIVGALVVVALVAIIVYYIACVLPRRALS